MPDNVRLNALFFASFCKLLLSFLNKKRSDPCIIHALACCIFNVQIKISPNKINYRRQQRQKVAKNANNIFCVQKKSHRGLLLIY